LNGTPDTSGVKHLLADDALVDTFRMANPDAPGFTVWQPVRTEAPAARRRVDYVLVAPGADAPARVRASRVILDRPGRGADGKALLGPLPQRPPPCVSPPRGPRRPGPPGDRSLRRRVRIPTPASRPLTTRRSGFLPSEPLRSCRDRWLRRIGRLTHCQFAPTSGRSCRTR